MGRADNWVIKKLGNIKSQDIYMKAFDLSSMN